MNYFLVPFLVTFLFLNAFCKSPTQIVNGQLQVLKTSLFSLNVPLFYQLFADEVDTSLVFQPDFLYPNNVFASMGDPEFKNSLKIFSPYEASFTPNGEVRALVTITYKMGGREHKMDKEVQLAKSSKSHTDYVFTMFQ